MGTGAMMPMQQQGEPPWVLIEELKRDFNVKEIEPNATTIPDDVKVLLVIHPKGISEATQFALDQFVLRGGKLIAFLDPWRRSILRLLRRVLARRRANRVSTDCSRPGA